MNKIIFIGGIHGVGKSNISKEICSRTDFNRLVASELININNTLDKRVSDLDKNQDKLLLGLKSTIKEGEDYLLDGHFCLLIVKDSSIQNIPIEIFSAMEGLSKIVVIMNNPETIQKGLKARDDKNYGIEFLENFQHQEIEHAKIVSDTLGVPIKEFWVSKDNIDDLISFIQN